MSMPGFAPIDRPAAQDGAGPTPSSPAQATTASIRQAYPNVYSEPQPQNWYYYDPTRHRPSFFATPLPLSPSVFAPRMPVPSDTTPGADSTLLASLKTLQSQFSAFQESLGNVNVDVKDALSQLRALRTAQSKTERCIADMESVIGITSTVRDRGGRPRGRGGKAVSGAEGADPATAPENTLVKSVASIQSAVQLLLARENQPSQHQTSSLLPPNPAGQESSHPSPHLMDSSRQFSALRSSQFISPIQQSGLSSPLSPLPTPTPFNTSPTQPPPAKEYAHASTQACPLSPSSEFSYSHSDVPGLTLVDWSAVPVACRHPISSLVQQTAFTTEQSGPSQLPSGTNTLAGSQTSQRDTDYSLRGSATLHSQLPTCRVSEPSASHYSGTLQVHSTVPGTSDSSKTLVVPSPSGFGLETQTLAFQRSSITLSPIGGAVGFPSEPSGDPGIFSPLNTLTSTCDDPISVPGASISGDQPCSRLGPDVAEMTPQEDSDTALAIGDINIRTSGPIYTASRLRRHSTPIEVDADAEPPSGLPTPPSETFSSDHELLVINRLTREHMTATDPKINSCAHIRSPHPIPTPPALPPEPSVEDLGMWQGSTRQECFGVFSKSLSPLTPSPLSPCPGAGDSLVEQSIDDVSQPPYADEVMEDTVNAGGPIVTATNEPPQSTAKFGDDSLPAPKMAWDGDLFTTPESSVGQPDLELPDHDPDTSIASAYYQVDGYDFRFSSLRRPSPPTPPTPSRYATPTDSSNSRRAQEEDEVWGVLMLGVSDISTPMLDSPPLPLMFSDKSSRAPTEPLRPSSRLATSTSTSAQELFAVNPSMLQDPPPLLRVSGSPNLPLGRTGSLSSLTSLDDANEEIEPLHLESRSSPLRATTPPNAFVTRVASEATRGDRRGGTLPFGGPSASLDQLALLARREPLKIHLKVPEWMRGLKRKRDVINEKKDEPGGETSHVGSECARSEAHGPSGKARWEEQKKVARTRMLLDAPQAPSSTLGTSNQSQFASQSSITHNAVDVKESLDNPSHSFAHRKRTKKRNRKETHVPPHKDSKRASKAKRRSPTTYHVWNGQIVAVERESEPSLSLAVDPPQTPAKLVAPQSPIHAKDGEELDTSSDRTRQESRVSKVPLLPSPVRSSQRSSRAVKTSRTKEDVWDSLYQSGTTWPKLPVEFNQWDIQFIQCDNCDKWYHYGCVAIQSEDPRLELGSLFICPTCHIQSARRQTLRHQEEVCARPHCPAPQVASDTETFYLEKLVGRKRVEGYLYLWLAKWDGYPMSQATWIPRENVIGDRTRMFNAFLEEALEEGADLSQDLILLREAVDGGWEQ